MLIRTACSVLGVATLAASCAAPDAEFAYRTPVVPIRFVIDTDGTIRFEFDHDKKLVTPVGTFSINAGADLVEKSDDDSFVVVFRDRRQPNDSADAAYRIDTESELDVVMVGAAMVSQRDRAILIDISTASRKVVALYPRGGTRVGPIPAIAHASRVAPDGFDGAGRPVGYDPMNVVDDNPATAWRVPGNGRGHWIQVNFPPATRLRRVRIVTGYTKRDPETGDDRFRQNRRVLRARLVFDGGRSLDVTLRDSRRPQWFDVDVPTTRMRLVVRSTTPHGGRDFTAVSEFAGYY